MVYKQHNSLATISADVKVGVRESGDTLKSTVGSPFWGALRAKERTCKSCSNQGQWNGMCLKNTRRGFPREDHGEGEEAGSSQLRGLVEAVSQTVPSLTGPLAAMCKHLEAPWIQNPVSKPHQRVLVKLRKLSFLFLVAFLPFTK